MYVKGRGKRGGKRERRGGGGGRGGFLVEISLS